MEKKWDGKTKGSLAGYKFFVGSVKFLGLRFAYFFCFFVAFYFVVFAKKQRNALIQFYQKGFQKSKTQALFMSVKTFNSFGKVLIDRIAFKTKHKSKFTHTFDNEQALLDMSTNGKGGFLFSGHVGNWENAGSLIKKRVTIKINVLMLDQEVEQIKQYIEATTEGTQYNIIPLKDDMSHLVLIHQALKRNELIALHADRTVDGQKNIVLPFLNGNAAFPAGPFIMAHKFKVPISFVFAVKGKAREYHLSATDGKANFESPEEVAVAYVQLLEEKVKKYPNQWFNFYDYYVN